MKPRKEFFYGSLLVWLILLPTANSLPAGCPDFECTVSGNSPAYGLYVYNKGSGSAIIGYTVANDYSFYGVGGYGVGVAYGVYGRSDHAAGVYGESDDGSGVEGYSEKGSGVYGSSSYSYGVYGTTDGAKTGAVVGENKGSEGYGVGGYAANGWGVWGVTNSEDYAGVQGKNLARGVAVAGYAEKGTGVVGEGALNGVCGLSHSVDHYGGWFRNDAQGWGVYAETNSPSSANRATIAGFNAGSGYGLQAQSKQGTGIAGKGLNRGVHGVATATDKKGSGVFGSASGTAGVGVEGSSKEGKGIQGNTDTGAAVYGVANAAKGWAGKFLGVKGAHGVSITTEVGKVGLIVSGGSKSAVVATSQGSRLLYAEEATEVYFTDYGSGRLMDGKAVIPVDPLFAETVNLGQPYHVFVQSYSDAQLVVSRRSPREFEVRLHARDTEGDRNAEFSYRLVAKRKGFEQARLEESPYRDDTEKRMDAAAPGRSEEQAFASTAEPADLPEPPDVLETAKPQGPHSPLRDNTLSFRSIGDGR